jgi:hypothetical protein
VIRDLMSIFLSVELNDEQQGRILDKAFAFLNSGTYDLGVMFNSMKFLEKSCRQWPDLIPEFVEVLKRQRDLHTSTFCKQATKLIFKFEKLR